ncbi:cytidylate kinase [Bacteroidales bacterium Barb4]|nr:cytidylate kinase [Bacteroidales bacterium Barb4]
MKDRIILTIGRQFGSGGGLVGKQLAKALGIGYYDKELLAVAARESGLCQETFERADERTDSGLSRALTAGYSCMGMYMPYPGILSNDGLFKFQSDAIRHLAEQESCVIVGRCADYILRDNPVCLSFFIHDSKENRTNRIKSYRQINDEEAAEQMRKNDKTRAAYYNYYTNKTWGVAASYRLTIDVSVLGIDGTTAFIKDFVERAF